MSMHLFQSAWSTRHDTSRNGHQTRRHSQVRDGGDQHGERSHLLGRDAVGLEVRYKLADGRITQRTYLDSAASTLQLSLAREVMTRFQPYYSNTHSSSHFGAKLCTRAYSWAHQTVLEFVDADPDQYAAVFMGSGATRGMNHIARVLRLGRPDHNVVLATAMEHHSNDLPHRFHSENLIHIPPLTTLGTLGALDLNRLEQVLKSQCGRVNYVAVTGASNVTGIVNPIHEVARLAHCHGALIVVDAAQMAAHMPIRTSGHEDPLCDLDVVVFSGHKIYAPGSPGVVVARKEIFDAVEPQEVGGGMVDDVSWSRYIPTQTLPDREEAGTPNIPGAIALAAVLYALKRTGMQTIESQEQQMARYALERLQRLEGVILYGPEEWDQSPRIGTVVFNLKDIPHTLTATILNDYFNISVRAGCFCAHPYVRELITNQLACQDDALTDEQLESLAELHRGMVRASFGIYNTRQDVDRLVDALGQIVRHAESYGQHYTCLPDGKYAHKTFRFESSDYFCAESVVNRWLGQSGRDESFGSRPAG